MKIIYPINVSDEYDRRYKIWFEQEQKRLARCQEIFEKFKRKKGDILHAPFLFGSATYQEKNETYAEFETRILLDKGGVWDLFKNAHKVIDRDNWKIAIQLQKLKDSGVTTAYLELE